MSAELCSADKLLETRLDVKCILHVLIFLYTHETYRSSACPCSGL